jgi:hypothetical protein
MTDYYKRKAKQDLWDNNGENTPKRYRYKGKARRLNKELAKKELESEEGDYDMSEEIEEALYCYYYGPCESCLAKSKK